MARAKKSKKTKMITIPSLKDVATRMLIPKGSYKAKVKVIEAGEGDEHAYFKWTFEIIAGKAKGQTPKPYYTSLSPASLWNIKAVLEAIGYKIPKGDFELDPEDVVGEELQISIDHEIYENRKQSVVVGFGEEEADEDDDDDDKDADDDEEDEDEEEDEKEELDADEINEMSQDELEDLCSENDLEVPFKKLKTLAKQRKAVVKAAKGAGLL